MGYKPPTGDEYEPLEVDGPHLCTERFRTVDLLLQALPAELEAIRLIRTL